MISIITPFYHRDYHGEEANYLFEKTEDSIKAQTNKEFEWVIIYDDWVSDIVATPSYDRGYKTIFLHSNYGPSVARNVGFQISVGDIIGYVDMGDTLHKNYIENVNSVFKSQNIDVLFMAYEIEQTINGKEYLHFVDPTTTLLSYYTGPSYKELLQLQNVSIPMGVTHTRKPFVECGGFQPGIVCGEDGVLWRRMLDKGFKYGRTYKSAGTYYVSETGQSRTQRRFGRGGFAFDASNKLGSHGQYLDKDWFMSYNSRELYEAIKGG